jgi:hypothetical protein
MSYTGKFPSVHCAVGHHHECSGELCDCSCHPVKPMDEHFIPDHNPALTQPPGTRRRKRTLEERQSIARRRALEVKRRQEKAYQAAYKKLKQATDPSAALHNTKTNLDRPQLKGGHEFEGVIKHGLKGPKHEEVMKQILKLRRRRNGEPEPEGATEAKPPAAAILNLHHPAKPWPETTLWKSLDHWKAQYAGEPLKKVFVQMPYSLGMRITTMIAQEKGLANRRDFAAIIYQAIEQFLRSHGY